MSQGTPLKRSQKTDFSTDLLVTRERSFIRSSKDHQRRKSQVVGPIKSKPTMEIYRPPNVRTDELSHTGKLNVHAKEFHMNNNLQSSKSSGNLTTNYEVLSLQHSKSSGNVLKPVSSTLLPIFSTPIPLPLLHSTSSHILNNISNVGYQYGTEILPQLLPRQSQLNEPIPFSHNSQICTTRNLKRSKSLGAGDSHSLMTKLKNVSKEDIDFAVFSAENQIKLKLAMEEPNQLSSRTMMDLVKIIMEQVVEGIRFCESSAKLCISIIEKENTHTFLESLLNMCQQWYQERDKILRGIKAGDGTRFTAFMWFLTEMCSQFKRHQLKEQCESLQPDLVLLSILAKCCQACVTLPIKCLSETECLFFVLTSIGRDLESELPQQLEQLLASVRDGFLASAGSSAVRRTLLQLIELHASNWQLPGSSVLYYYPRIK